MELEYTLSNEDSFTSALFVTSQSPVIKKRRRREQYIYPFVYLIMLGILFYINNSMKGILITMILTSLWVSLYPYLSKYAIRRKYFRNLKKQKNSDVKSNVKIKADKASLTVTNEAGQTKINMAEIDRIIEITNYFFIRINSKGHLVLPKAQFKTGELDAFIKKIQKSSNTDISQMMDWKWS